MSHENLNVPFREISQEDKRQIPEFLNEERAAVNRLQTPEIPRPVRPMYAFVRTFTPDLQIIEATPGMDLWAELRFMATGELNRTRWKNTVTIGDEEHTVALHGVYGETPNGEQYRHNALRCTCCLPNYKSNADLEDEYQECPAKNMIIDERTEVYRKIIGETEISVFDDQTLALAAVFMVNLVRKDLLAWPPSDRSDRLLVDPLAKVFGVPREMMRAGAEEMAHDKVVHLHGEKHPSISLAA